MSNQPSAAIARLISRLRSEGATGVDEYEKRLIDNSGNSAVLDDLFFEGRAALMFLRNDFQVTMRENPDLRLTLDEEVLYAEVKHFHEKYQDRSDEQAMLEATDIFVPIGDTTATEEHSAWQQVVRVAVRKVSQYMGNAPNILVVESSSDSLELTIESAVHEYDEKVLRSSDPRLRRLNGIVLVNTCSVAFGPPGSRNVEFCQTCNAAVPLSGRLAAALTGIYLA